MRFLSRFVAVVVVVGGVAHASPPSSAPATTTTTASSSAAPAPASCPSTDLIVYVARHGETAWNVAHKLQGLTDIPLDDKGKQQAELLRDLLAGIHVDAVYSSTLSRSIETAKTAS